MAPGGSGSVERDRQVREQRKGGGEARSLPGPPHVCLPQPLGTSPPRPWPPSRLPGGAQGRSARGWC